MTSEIVLGRLENIFGELAQLGGKRETTAIVSGLLVIDATPTGLADYIIVRDNIDGDNIPALKVPGIIYAVNDLVSVLFIEGTEPVAFQQSPKSSSNGVAVSKLVSPNGLIDPVFSADNSGDVTLADGDLIFGAAGQISVTGLLQINATGGIVVNEGNSDVDFRIEGDTEENLLFIDAGNERVGIGLNDPVARFHIEDEGVSTNLRIRTYGTSGTTKVSSIVGSSARGTKATPTATGNTDVLFTFGGEGYDGAAFSGNQGVMQFVASQNWTAANQGTLIAFQTTANNGVARTEKMRIFSDGEVSIGTTSRSAQLRVDQASTTKAIPVLFLDQGDVSEEMIQFATTIGVGNAIEAVGAKTLTVTHFIKVTLPGALTRYIEVGTIA